MCFVVIISNSAIEILPQVIKVWGVTGGKIAVCTVIVPSVLDRELFEVETAVDVLTAVASFLQAAIKKNMDTITSWWLSFITKFKINQYYYI